MKATTLIQIMTILFFSIRFTIDQNTLSTRPAMLFTKSSAAVTTPTENTSRVGKIEENANWLIVDDESHWTADEAKILRCVLQNTFDTLASNDINGMALIDGYRFRRQAGDYVGGAVGRMGTIDHNIGEITLSDKAFTVQHGFAIYHELGHAVDYQLNRELSEGFHGYIGGSVISEDGQQWQTADNYWLRLQGRDDREEAAADAFAVLVMGQAGLERPIFANQPITTDYNGIAVAAAVALQTIE